MAKKKIAPDPDLPLTDNEWKKLGPPIVGRAGLEKIFGKKAADDLVQGRVKLRPGRPVAENPKDKVTIRLDRDILHALRASGTGWQTRLNDKLREWVKP